jgi:hypothetical protein
LLKLADLTGEAILFFLEPFNIRQGIAPAAVEPDELVPVNLGAAGRHTRFHFVEIFPQ